MNYLDDPEANWKTRAAHAHLDTVYPSGRYRQEAARKPLPRSTKRIDRGSRPSRVRQTKRGKEKANLQTRFSLAIRSRDPLCVIRYLCAAQPSTEAAHILTQGAHRALALDLENALGACRLCHDYMTRNRKEWDRWCERNIPELLARLKAKSRVTPKCDREAARVAIDAMLAHRPSKAA